MVRRYHLPVDDPDIWRAASLLVKRYGADAAEFAARRLDESAGDADPPLLEK